MFNFDQCSDSSPQCLRSLIIPFLFCRTTSLGIPITMLCFIPVDILLSIAFRLIWQPVCRTIRRLKGTSRITTTSVIHLCTSGSNILRRAGSCSTYEWIRFLLALKTVITADFRGRTFVFSPKYRVESWTLVMRDCSSGSWVVRRGRNTKWFAQWDAKFLVSRCVTVLQIVVHIRILFSFYVLSSCRFRCKWIF